jgi:hypothetical protein
MNDVKPAVLLFRGRGIISSLIRWQTRGTYSHAAFLLRDGRIVEAWQGRGVHVRELDSFDGIARFSIPEMTDEQWDVALGYALSQVGKGYDYWGVLRFLSRRMQPENDRWFCSELVVESLNQAGVYPFKRTRPSEVSPGLLSISPILKPEADLT